MSAVTAPLRKSHGRRHERRHLRVVPENRPRHTLRFVLLALVLTGAAVFGTVSLNALAAGDAVRAHELEEQVVQAERRYSQLVADVAGLETPARIERAAERIGMVPAGAPRYLELERRLPTDGGERLVDAGETADPMKPVLSAGR